MSVTTPAELDALILKATSESIPNGELDLPSALEISDVVRSRRISPKECMRCLKRRIMATTTNPNTQLASWKLTDICIKNGGIPFIKEICSREFMDTMENTIIKSGKDIELQDLTSSMFYELYVAFQNDSQLNYVTRVYDKLVSHGIHFPETVTQASGSIAMFDSRTPADWVESDACMICSKKFSFLTRRHHCRSCGGIFCQDHSSNFIVLPDLGIYEPVRVCDNCFEDYNLKKGTGSKKKRHGNKKSKKKKSASDGVEDYEDEELSDDLRKAIELSLKESKGNVEPIVPVMERKDAKLKSRGMPNEEEEDPQLKAAIEASLREADEEKKRRELLNQQQQQQQQNSSQVNYYEQPQHSAPSNEISAAEEEDIHLFASLVERMKTQSPAEILEDTQLQTLYRKVIGTRPKLNNALNEVVQKYNLLMEMNTKISDIMNIYDDLLEAQLKNINLSERYSLPQAPSDPYSYIQKEKPVQQQIHQGKSQYAPRQDYSRQTLPLPSQNYEQQRVSYEPRLQQLSPPPEQQAHLQSHPQQPAYASPPEQQAQLQSHPQQPAYASPPEQQAQLQSHPQQPAYAPPHLKQAPYLNQSEYFQVQTDPNRESMANLPSEPPYPTAEDESEPREQLNVQGQSSKSSESIHDVQNPLARRKLSNGRPYPLEDEDATNLVQSSEPPSTGAITNYDFPTVPTQKVLESEISLPSPAIENENSAEPSQAEEELLIEL